VEWGSKTAKNGFKNEDDIVIKFKNWKEDEDAKEWLRTMGYKLEEIEKVEALKVYREKTDVQVQITIYLKKVISAENLSIKLVSNPRGYNQVDKRWVNKYVELWDIPDDVAHALKLFTGETKPNRKKLKDSRRMFFYEMDENTQQKVIDFFTKKRFLIVSDILKGRGKLSAGWMLVALNERDKPTRWILKSINHVLNVFGNGEVLISDRGNLWIGKITMQRKGGDGGRDTAKMLQFKINPIELFTA